MYRLNIYENYPDGGFRFQEFGKDALEKDDDADGYPNLYDYRKSHSAEMLFKHLISWHTHYGGHTTAIEACKLMDIGEGWRE